MDGRIVGFGVITCAASATETPTNPCGGAWRVRPGEVWVDGNNGGMPNGRIDPGELVDNGSAKLFRANSNAGTYRVPTEFVVCLKLPPSSAAVCEGLVTNP